MSVVDEVKARLDIVDVLSPFILLEKKGQIYKALCPFHTENTPSFVVFPETQTWRCFGQCGEGGDAFSFLMKHEGLSFSEALQKLADKTGIRLDNNHSQKSNEQVQQEDRLYGVLREAAHFFSS